MIFSSAHPTTKLVTLSGWIHTRGGRWGSGRPLKQTHCTSSYKISLFFSSCRFAVGTSHGFGVVDYHRQEVLYSKSTLEPLSKYARVQLIFCEEKRNSEEMPPIVAKVRLFGATVTTFAFNNHIFIGILQRNGTVYFLTRNCTFWAWVRGQNLSLKSNSELLRGRRSKANQC